MIIGHYISVGGIYDPRAFAAFIGGSVKEIIDREGGPYPDDRRRYLFGNGLNERIRAALDYIYLFYCTVLGVI